MDKDFKTVDIRRFFILIVVVLIFGCYTPPKDAVLRKKALDFCLKREYDQCISACNKALAINPSSWETYQVRAMCYKSKGNYDQAIADFTRMSKTLPSHLNKAGTITNRGDCYRLKGNYDRAIADYRRALTLSPGFLPAIQGYENALKDQMRKARAHYDSTVAPEQKAPQTAGKPSYDSWIGDAKIAYNKGDYDKVIDICNRVLKRNPKEARAYSYRGLAFYGKSLVDKAIDEHTAVIRIEPDNWAAYHNLGRCYHRKGEYRKAIGNYTSALKRFQKSAPTYHYRGEAYEKLGLLSEAFGDAQKAISLQPTNKKFQSRLSYVKAELAKQHAVLMQEGSQKQIDIQLYRTDVKPQRVPPGAKFDLFLDYSVTDPSAKVDRLSVGFNYRILQGEKSIFNSKRVVLKTINGERTARIIHLKAARQKGIYTIEVSLEYKNKMRGYAVDLVIE